MKNSKPNSQLLFSDLSIPQDISDAKYATQLLSIKDSTELEELLKERFGNKIFSTEKCWRPVGDQRSNAGAIEASPDEINPLIERIVNGIEAVTELGVAEKRLIQPDQYIPNSPCQAIEFVFGIPDGLSERLDEDTARTKFGDYVQLRLRGNRSTPTIVIQDKGIGIHPSEFPKTIVSLGQSSKGQKEYLIGMYGQGGSSAFEKSEYSIIFSRKHPNFLKKDEQDVAGWTVVRKRLSVRTHIYEYLVSPETGQVFTIAGNLCEKIGFNNGTHVCHVSYKNLGSFATQKMTNYAWYALNFRLFNPLIPWTLIDERDGSGELRTMRGVPYRINQLPKSATSILPTPQKGKGTSVRHHIKYTYPDPLYGSIIIEWWVLQAEEITDGRRGHSTKVDPYRDPSKRYAQRRVAITRGGQVHAALTTNMFTREGLRFIADSVIVNVNTDKLSFEAGASFFASNRADLKRESEEIIEKAIGAAIYQYKPELMEIQREREREITRGRGAKDEDVLKAMLNPMIKAFLSSVSVGKGDATRRQRSDAPRFKGKAIPTILEFARTSPLEILPGIPTHLELITDASDTVMTSRKTTLRFPQSISPEIAEICVAGGGDGRWRIRIVPFPEVNAGAKCDLSASLEQSAWQIATKKPCHLVVVSPPEEYVGSNPPTYMRFKSRVNDEVYLQQGGGRISIDTDCQDNLFDYADFKVIKLPEKTRLLGFGHPSRGQIRLTIATDDDIELGQVGEIAAKLELSDGSSLSAEAKLVITKKQKIESGNLQNVPNYDIGYVREVAVDEKEFKWDEMCQILTIESPWNADDVGGFMVGHDNENLKLHIYINLDNKEMANVEKRMAKTSTESTIDSFRKNHRALIIYHLYLLGISDESGNLITDLDKRNTAKPSQMEYNEYRNEMIRLNRTALLATKEYLDTIRDIQNTD